jgi:hypothetical protein
MLNPRINIYLTLFISGKLTLLVQGAASNLEVEEERLLVNREGPPDNANITTVVIQRLSKNAVALYNSKNISVPSSQICNTYLTTNMN